MTTNFDGWGPEPGPISDETRARNLYAQTHQRRNRVEPARRSGKTPEAKVSAANDKYLATLPCMVLRTSAGMTEINGRRIRIGKAGTSDKTILFPGGRWVSLEEKATTDLTDDQKKYRAQVIALGGIFIESRSKEDTRAGLVAAFGEQTVKDWEALGRARAAQLRNAKRNV